MKIKQRILFFTVVLVILLEAGTGGAVSFTEDGPFQITHMSDIISPPAAEGDRILWIETNSSSYNNSFPNTCEIYSYNTTTGTKILIRSGANNARSPDIDGKFAVWEEERRNTTDIVLYNFATGKVMALHSIEHQHNPRIGNERIVWEEGFEGERSIFMYNIKSGGLYELSTGKIDCFSPDIDENTVVWVEKSKHNRNSIVSQDIISGRRILLGTKTTQVYPRISDGRVIWVENEVIYLASTEKGVLPLTNRSLPSSDAIIGSNIVAWSENGRIHCHDLTDGQKSKIGIRHSSTKPAILEEGIVWVEEDYRGLFCLRYQPFSYSPSTSMQIEPGAPATSGATGNQRGSLHEGESAWYALDISPGTTRLSLNLSWNKAEDSLSCTLISPGDAILRFTDSNDEIMDGMIRISVTSIAGIIPGRWYCAVSGESVREEIFYTITWYECEVQK